MCEAMGVTRSVDVGTSDTAWYTWAVVAIVGWDISFHIVDVWGRWLKCDMVVGRHCIHRQHRVGRQARPHGCGQVGVVVRVIVCVNGTD